MTKHFFGKTAYDILAMRGCPIKLPHATSMTQARIDYEHRQDAIMDWYKSQYLLRMKNFFSATIKKLSK